jgi:hypothetical protein
MMNNLFQNIMNRVYILFFFMFSAALAEAQTTTYGCNDPNACNYQAGGFTVNSGCKYADDVCDDGDANTFASHYNNDCNCVETIVGCMDSSACNYNTAATEPHTCIYPYTQDTASYSGNGAGCWVCSQTIGLAPHGDGKGVLENNDINDNGICDNEEVFGCMNAAACNFNPEATSENAVASQNGVEAISPCVFAENCNYCGILTADGSTDSLLVDSSGDQYASHPSYGVLDGDKNQNGTCDIIEIYGCMDSQACNFNALATADTSIIEPVCVPRGSCGCDDDEALNLEDDWCACSGAKLDSIDQCLLVTDPNFCLADDNANGICDSSEVEGCMDADACNYDALANVDNDSCEVDDECGECGGAGAPSGFCDCAGTQPDVNGNGLCDASETTGCTDVTSCTYNLDATWHVESDCQYLDACNICGGSGLADPSHCNCQGEVLDALGNCGGKCEADVDGDGICDNVDPCLISGEEPDECGVCAGPGAIYECGCEPLLDRACNCDPSTGEQFVPNPGKDCDGNCLNGQDENNQCIVSSTEIVTEMTSPLMARVEGNSVLKEINPFDLERWLDRVDTLHSRMSRNLDDGSLLGKSDSLTIEHQILNKGKLYVQDDAVFSDIVRMDTNVTIGGNLLIEGWARIKGTTFSDGGIETTTLDMKGSLSVGGAVSFDSTLSVAKNVHFHDSLAVDNRILVGNANGVILESDTNDVGFVSSDVGEFRQKLTAGAARVVEDVDIGGDLIVNDRMTVGSSQIQMTAPLSLLGNFTVSGTQDFGGAATFSESANFAKAASIGKDLTVGKNIIHNGSEFKSKAGTVYFGQEAGNLSIRNSIIFGTTSVLSSHPSAKKASQYSMIVDGKGSGNINGIAIRVDAVDPGNSSDFITFIDKEGDAVGSIKGNTADYILSDPEYTGITTDGTIDIGLAALDLRAATTTAAKQVKKIAEEFTKSGGTAIPGAGLPDSDVAEAIVHAGTGALNSAVLVNDILNSTTATIALSLITIGAAAAQGSYFNRMGVVYRSGGADYAEWIEKENHRIDLLPGEIVGVTGGMVSRETSQADHVLVVSMSPIVLGNVPQDQPESHFEKIAFLGQVPIRINGPVRKGDYILPSGENDGTGFAVSPEVISMRQVPLIVAVAWEEGTNEFFNIVNCSIGLGSNGLNNLVGQIEARFEDMEFRLFNELNVMFANAGMSVRKVTKAQRKEFRLTRKSRWKTSTKNDARDVQLARTEYKPTLGVSKPTNITTQESEVAISESFEEMLNNPENQALLQESIESLISDLSDDGLVITQQEWAEGLLQLEQATVQSAQMMDSFLANGGDLEHNSFAMFGVGEMPQAILEADARISLAVFDYFVNENSIRALIQNELMNEIAKNPRQKAAFLQAFPSGSQQEAELIQKTISDLEQGLYDSFPTIAHFGRGRAK